MLVLLASVASKNDKPAKAKYFAFTVCWSIMIGRIFVPLLFIKVNAGQKWGGIVYTPNQQILFAGWVDCVGWP